MGAFLGVSHFFKRPLYEVARDLGYGEDNISFNGFCRYEQRKVKNAFSVSL